MQILSRDSLYHCFFAISSPISSLFSILFSLFFAIRRFQLKKEWSSVCDSVIHNKPKFIKRTRDKMWFSNLETMDEILKAYKFTARFNLGKAILEYSADYYDDYEVYSHSPNRRQHIPYIFKALVKSIQRCGKKS